MVEISFDRSFEEKMNHGAIDKHDQNGSQPYTRKDNPEPTSNLEFTFKKEKESDGKCDSSQSEDLEEAGEV